MSTQESRKAWCQDPLCVIGPVHAAPDNWSSCPASAGSQTCSTSKQRRADLDSIPADGDDALDEDVVLVPLRLCHRALARVEDHDVAHRGRPALRTAPWEGSAAVTAQERRRTAPLPCTATPLAPRLRLQQPGARQGVMLSAHCMDAHSQNALALRGSACAARLMLTGTLASQGTLNLILGRTVRSGT